MKLFPKAAYIAPTVTLLGEDGQPSARDNAALYAHLIRGGIDGLLVLGSIGEFFAMPYDTRRAVARDAIRAVAGRVPVMVGTGGMVFDEIAPFSNDCLSWGADAVIVISPYYFSLDDAAVFAFYDRLANAIQGRLYLYNFPARTGYSLSAEVVARLAFAHENIVGVKDSVPGMESTRAYIDLVLPRRPDFEVFSGFDNNLSANVAAGGAGCISGLSNVYPAYCAYAARALRDGDPARSAAGQRLIEAMFDLYDIAGNFVPVIKEGVRLRGVVASSQCLFPLPSVTQAERKRLRALMARVERMAETLPAEG